MDSKHDKILITFKPNKISSNHRKSFLIVESIIKKSTISVTASRKKWRGRVRRKQKEKKFKVYNFKNKDKKAKTC